MNSAAFCPTPFFDTRVCRWLREQYELVVDSLKHAGVPSLQFFDGHFWRDGALRCARPPFYLVKFYLVEHEEEQAQR